LTRVVLHVFTDTVLVQLKVLV